MEGKDEAKMRVYCIFFDNCLCVDAYTLTNSWVYYCFKRGFFLGCLDYKTVVHHEQVTGGHRETRC